MRKRLPIASMLTASTLFATSLSLVPPSAWAGSEDSVRPITATDDHGRKIYVNESFQAPTPRRTQTAEAPRHSLMYWSVKENRWKPVPGHNAAMMKAARSAAAEVTQYFGRDSYRTASAKIQSANFSSNGWTR